MHYPAGFFDTTRAQMHTRPLRRAWLTAFAVILVMILLPACSRNETILEVGERKLTKSLFEKRMKHVQLLHPKYDEDEIARGLIEGWAAADVLEQHGVGLTREILENERQTIRKDDEVRRLFLSAQRIYGQTGEDMLDVGLLPDSAMRELHNRFVQKRLASERAQLRAQAFIEDVRDAPETLEAKAAALNLTVTDFVLEPELGEVRNMDGEPVRPFAQNWEESTLAAIRLGALASSANDGRLLGLTLRIPRGILVLQRLGKDDRFLKMRAVHFTYDEFAEWLTEETRNLRVCIHDEALRERFIATGSPVQIHCP